ncbi:FAD-dependent monooxygenase [Shimia sp. R10_1]|uniref:NAD(P)/FAD-dependent oxidoreductase n=1 Tax=Shimia sp. R10_1 TaxID=2821095 RepID=UPI001ADBE7F5|nr:FAD-dependent monooxygenase [Shimia sp. R10_1]MBO9475709.1 FAD-dependent monooxygenase [Shimia sp. R10_1]
MRAVDVLVIGGGPAGLSAGIHAASVGLKVLVLERAQTLPAGPGETFHPGIEAIFGSLGIAEITKKSATARHEEILIHRCGRTQRVKYGPGWCGFQLRRSQLNQILQARLLETGGEVQFGTVGYDLCVDKQGFRVKTKPGTIETRWIVDASGYSGWLDQNLEETMTQVSHPIWLEYGYRCTDPKESNSPSLKIGDMGWHWQAPLGDGETAWVRGSDQVPKRSAAGSKLIDGTWRFSKRPASANYFRVGDAACRLDPRNGHGVLRAMMSAIMAGHLIKATNTRQIEAEQAAQIYTGWLHKWFQYDADQLQNLSRIL